MDNKESAVLWMLYASNNIQVSSSGVIISGLVTDYYLRSADKPEVRTFECIQLDDQFNNPYLSIEAMLIH